MARASKGEIQDLVALIRRLEPVGPTFREIRDLWGVRSLSETKQRLEKLREDGLIDWLPRRARSLHLVRENYYITRKNEVGDTILVPLGGRK